MSHLVRSWRFVAALTIIISVSSRAQTPNSPLTVAEATQQASQLGSAPVFVHGHFWCGKEGSMIYDSYYKSVLRMSYSEICLKKHTSYSSRCGFDSKHESNLVTVTGHIQKDKDGKLILLADEVTFDK